MTTVPLESLTQRQTNIILIDTNFTLVRTNNNFLIIHLFHHPYNYPNDRHSKGKSRTSTASAAKDIVDFCHEHEYTLFPLMLAFEQWKIPNTGRATATRAEIVDVWDNVRNEVVVAILHKTFVMKSKKTLWNICTPFIPILHFQLYNNMCVFSNKPIILQMGDTCWRSERK